MPYPLILWEKEFVMMYGYGSGWMLLWMTLFMGGTILLVIWGIRQWSGSNRQDDSRALGILEERYARGDIDREQFESRRQGLRG